MTDRTFGVRDALLAVQKSGEALHCRLTNSGQLTCERSEVSTLKGSEIKTRVVRGATFLTARAANGDDLGCTILAGRHAARCTEARFLTQIRAGIVFGQFAERGLQGITFRDGVANWCEISGATPKCQPVQGLEAIALASDATVAAIHSSRTGRADLVSVSGRQLKVCRAQSSAEERVRFSCQTESLDVDVTDLKLAVVVGRSVLTGLPKTEALAVLPARRSQSILPTPLDGQASEIANVRAVQEAVTSALKRARISLGRAHQMSALDSVVGVSDSTLLGATRIHAAILPDQEEDPEDVGYPALYEAILSDNQRLSWWSDTFELLLAYSLSPFGLNREECIAKCNAQAAAESQSCEMAGFWVTSAGLLGTGVAVVGLVAFGPGLLATGTVIQVGVGASFLAGEAIEYACKARVLVERQRCVARC